MKKILAILLGVLFVGLSAQTTPPTGASTTENYVYSRTYLEAVTSSSTTAKQVQGIQYFDGLGRPKQSIAIKATPLGRDVVTPVVYDGFGRQTRDYLPIPQSATTNGTIYTQNTGLVSYPVSDPTNIYASEKIYSEKVLESSPLDRVFQQVQPGNDWSNKPIQFDYLTNDSLEVKKYTITTTWAVANTDIYTTTSSLPTISSYGKNTLYKNKVTDEDGNVSYEFKNGQGQTLLVRKVLSATQNADTYYVYNEYNQLALVIPPLAAAKSTLIQSDLDELCYQYRYDNQNRLVEKKLPGKGWEYMVYDQQDRLVLTQDAMLRGTTNNFTKRGWLFTKYDQFGRVVYTGFFANTATRETMQKSLNSMSSNAANNETRDNTAGFTQNGLTVYYTKTAFPTGSMTILSVNYYDQYPADLATIPTTIQGETILSATSQTTDKINTRSLPLASFVKNIDTDSWTKNYTFYDLKSRAIGTHSYNYLGGYTKTESKLDFAGVPQESYTYHKRLSTDTEITIKEKFEYDGQNRLIKHWHNVNNAANDELLTFNEYNELGQLKNKKVGGNATTPLQTVDYKYNIRGWMTNINDLANLGTDLFGYNINYNTLNANFSGTAKYNGNIAQTTWKTNYSGADTKTRNYSYVYDRLNRLLDAKYTALGTTNDQDYYNENLTYDVNGNITTLKRYSNPASGTTAQKIDDLVYNYENAGYSNKLNKITLPAGEVNNPSGYNALQNAINYDANGNMINQLDKNISAISYNFLNLPYQVTQTGGNTNYVYRADGLKVKKIYGTKVTDYLDGFQYENAVLQFVPTSEGYYDFANSRYTYNYTDHLGNVRLSYYKNSAGVLTTLEEINYYPFGLKHTGYNSLAGNPAYKLGYNGKELQETGQIDYGARFYMPDIGRWGTVDPLAEKTMQPYSYANNNPIRFIDPTGMAGEDTKGGTPPGERGFFGRVWDWLTGTHRGYESSTTLKPSGRLDVGMPTHMSESEYASWEANGNSYEQVTSNTLIIRKTGPNNDSPKYGFILPQNLGGWSQDDTASDGLIYKGCLSCHADNGAFTYASHNSQEANGGRILASILGAVAGGAIGSGSTNTMNPNEIHFMQSSIKNTTGEFTVLGNAEALANGSLNPNVLRMTVWKDASGKVWTLDHRRLGAFRLSGLQEAPIQWGNPSGQMWKMTTTNGGTSIKLKLGGGNSITIE